MNNNVTGQQTAFQTALERVGVMGRGADQKEALQEIAETLSIKMGISLEEAFYMLSNALQEFQNRQSKVKAIFDKLKALAQEIEASFIIEPSARRRKAERDRARAIKQRYRAEIRRCERERPYRRIYKPP